VSFLRRTIRIYPALLRIGLAEAVAYRAEFFIWMLTTTLPLVMLALWTAVAREAPVGRFGQPDFVAYYLATYVVRTVTGSWVVWEMNHEIRTGTLSMRLLRPVHPFIAYSAEHLASIPLRALMALPMAIILLVTTSGDRLVHDPVLIALLPVVLLGTWLITFLSMLIMGTLGLFMERSIAVFEVWLGAFALLSGYLVPLELMPETLRRVSDWLPFRYMLGFPVELATGMLGRGEALRQLAMQLGWVAVLALVVQGVWKAGLKRFEAFGS
jgi:viologen exporter family transport system permease protein